MALEFAHLYHMSWGIVQPNARLVGYGFTRLDLPVTGFETWATVDDHECIVQQTFAPMAAVDSFCVVNATKGTITGGEFRLYDLTASALIGKATIVNPPGGPYTTITIASGDVPAADSRVALQYWTTGPGGAVVGFLAACWIQPLP